MKYYTIEEFVKHLTDNGHEESLWVMIEQYKTWKKVGMLGDCLLRSNAQAFCSNVGIPLEYHSDYMEWIALGIYDYFALKYKEMTK